MLLTILHFLPTISFFHTKYLDEMKDKIKSYIAEKNQYVPKAFRE